MQLHPDGTLVVSATDLVGFLACDHLATLEMGRAAGLWEKPPRREDPELLLLQERGVAHERAYLDRLRTEGRTVHEQALRDPRTPEELRDAEAETLAAMRSGIDVIYQATFFDGRWRGHADFLLKVDRPSDLGAWSYEVADTKLSRAVKGSALLQVCVYSDRLAQLQGLEPELVHVVTGDGETHAHRLADYAAFYRSVKDRFESAVFGDGAGPARDPAAAATYPDPVEHCRVCTWFPACMDRRRADDHLSLVAGMSRAATERLVEAGVPTLEALGGLPPDRPVPDLGPRTLERLREQARVQLEGRRTDRLLYELIPPVEGEPGRGLGLLPEPSPLDLFFDIEADPWAMDDGLEYLLGVAEVVDGGPVYRPIWGHDRDGEKRAFETFIDLVIERLDRDPGMHVYHYAGYESGAIRRLMQRHATREDEVDRILRGGVLVDLYNAVRQGIRASVESYSIKRIEKFYMAEREGPLTEAGFSVVAYETWLREGRPELLDELAAYNRDDCVSAWRLRDWLEERRREAIERGWPIGRPEPGDGAPSEALTEQLAATRRRREALAAGVPPDRRLRTAEEHARWLLAQLLEWHRRDDKPAWWLWFALRKSSMEDLIDSAEALGGLEFVGDVESRGRGGIIRRYRFPPQDHKFRIGQRPVDPGTADRDAGDAGEIVDVNDLDGTIDLLRGPSRQGFHPAALIPTAPIPSIAQRDALLRVADRVLEHGIDAPGRYRAARDLLLRRPPRLASGLAAGPLARPGEEPLAAARRLALELGDGGVLPIQGPPGTGKTFTGARMIVKLVDAGRKVGITAQSHKAITNMLTLTWEAAAERGIALRAIQKCDTGDDGAHLDGVVLAEDNADVAGGLASGSFRIAAGTSWLFARQEMEDLIDVLFVDEAGQMSLANVVAMSGCARSIVLLGDPNQLPQVSQGVHPEGAGASALEHLVGDAVTVAPERGLFLGTTYRLHPAINDYISETFYEDRLEPDETTARQRIDGPPPLGGVGIRWLPIGHAGDESSSRAEAHAAAGAVHELLWRTWTNRDGEQRPLTIDDVLIVAPYNAQVALVHATILDRIGTRGRVGTVDKFQGQEAPVAIYTMAASSAEDAPRGLDFLYQRNRLNVAVSRAKGLAIVIASPELLRAGARTPEQMRRINALCRLVEVAAEQARPAGVAAI
jgi:uncharacterized protein